MGVSPLLFFFTIVSPPFSSFRKSSECTTIGKAFYDIVGTRSKWEVKLKALRYPWILSIKGMNLRREEDDGSARRKLL